MQNPQPDALSALVADFAKLLGDKVAAMHSAEDDQPLADIRHLSAAIKDTVAAAKTDAERTGTALDKEPFQPKGVSPEMIDLVRRSVLGED